MTAKKDPPSREGYGAASAARTAKLAAALKDNLKRRKAQARARAGSQEGIMVRRDPGVQPGEPRTIESAPQKGPNAAKKR